MSSTTDQRLQAAQRSIQIATRQAYTALISSSDAIVGVDPSTAGNNDDINTSSNDSDNNRAGMDLGLKLFGTSQSYRNQIENEFHNKLRSVEKELADIQSSLESLHNNSTWSSRDLRGEQPPVERDDTPTEDDDDKDSIISSINDISQLQAHISFLQHCAKARKLLEDVDTLSLQTNFATSISSSSGSDRAGTTNSASSLYSPSSICSPSDFMRFAFNVEDDGKGSRDMTVSPMVQAAQFVNEACELLDNVMEGVSNQYPGDGDDNNVTDAAAVGAQNQGIIQMQSKMLHELQHQARRKKMELRHRAMTIVEGCIVVEWEEKGKLLLRGSGTTTLDSTSANKKSVTFDIVESPIPASSIPTNNNDTASTILPPSPLSDAYQVLLIFSDANFPSFGETLDGAMKRLSTKLMRVVRPCLQKLEENATATGGKEVGYYKFTQESLKSVRSAECRYDPVSIKGPAVQLQWSLVGVPTLNCQDNAETATTFDTHDSLATADAIDEKAIQSLSAEISSSAVAFLSSLNFITIFFTFIYQHVLLRRSDLAHMLGKHLFGTYPLPNTTIASGSAVLSGGTLVGAAAHGLESGEEMPLMYELVKSMRRHCIPTENSLMIWKLLQKMEQCLVMEVASFENKLVELGLMKDATASAGVVRSTRARDVPNAVANATSPTGLSVLMTDDDIAHSPNTSTMDTSLSSPTHHPEHTRKNEVISPLSELANSLRHAYVEGQRSLNLNQGRSILLNTDYHNTVQVGTFVPEPSDAGTLASLDDDPLKAFAFHQCSISTTAQYILSLCRKTMDDATNPDVASDLVDDSLPPMLFRAARELLDLFRAIVPTSHASEIGSIPRMAAVLHNDCVYLAHESSLLGKWQIVTIFCSQANV